MIYIDSKFRFYDDAKDLVKFPELKPPPEAVPLTSEQVTAITADISKWRWHPAEGKPYKLPDADKKYWKDVDGVILEMDEKEKAAVDQAEADALAAKLAAEQAAAKQAAIAQAALDAKIAAKLAAIADNLPSWTQVSTAVANIANLADAKVFLKKLARVVYWLAKDKAD